MTRPMLRCAGAGAGALAAALLAALLARAAAYSDVDNGFSYDAVAANATELRHHLACFLGREPCSPVAAHYKSHILDTLRDQCHYCTPQHKHNARAFLHAVRAQLPDGYRDLKRLYDPDDKLFSVFENYVDQF